MFPNQSTWWTLSATLQPAGGVVDQALALEPKPKVIWMQLGIRDDAAAARALGIKVVMNRCPKIEYERLAIGNA